MVDKFYYGDWVYTDCGRGYASCGAVAPQQLPAGAQPCKRCVARLRGSVEWWADLLAVVEDAGSSAGRSGSRPAVPAASTGGPADTEGAAVTPDHPHYETIEMMSDGQPSIIVNLVTQADWDAKCAEVERLKLLMAHATDLIKDHGRLRPTTCEWCRQIAATGPADTEGGEA